MWGFPDENTDFRECLPGHPEIPATFPDAIFALSDLCLLLPAGMCMCVYVCVCAGHFYVCVCMPFLLSLIYVYSFPPQVCCMYVRVCVRVCVCTVACKLVYVHVVTHAHRHTHTHTHTHNMHDRASRTWRSCCGCRRWGSRCSISTTTSWYFTHTRTHTHNICI